MGRQRLVIAEDFGGDVRVRRASDVTQQARVVRLRGRLRVYAQALGEPHREQRALQTVLKRHTDAQVRRQRQRRDHLRGTDPVAPRRCSNCHAATLPGLSIPPGRPCRRARHGASLRWRAPRPNEKRTTDLQRSKSRRLCEGWTHDRSGRPAVVTVDDVRSLAITAGSEREPIMRSRATGSRPLREPSSGRCGRVHSGLKGESVSRLMRLPWALSLLIEANNGSPPSTPSSARQVAARQCRQAWLARTSRRLFALSAPQRRRSARGPGPRRFSSSRPARRR